LPYHRNEAAQQRVHRQVLVHRGGGDTVGDAEAQRDDGQEVQDVVGVLQERLQRGELKKPKKTRPKRRGFLGGER